MRIKNFIKFLVCAVLCVAGLYLLSRNTAPNVPPDKPKEKPSEIAEARGTPETAAGGFGMHLALQQQREDERIRRAWTSQAIRWHQLGAVAGPGWAASGKAWPEAPVTERDAIILGSDGPNSPFHLQVKFDQRGAAVRRVILNKFKASDRLGHPAKDSRPFVLVPDRTDLPDGTNVPEDEKPIPEEYHVGSNILYHYEDDAKRPLDTLGKADWKLVGYKNGAGDDEHFVKFSAVVQGVEVTKTFRLPRKAYHLGLEVGMRRTEQAAKDAKFRYQLTGAHGLPVEGTWYTSTYRHALIGMMEGKSLWRNYQDNREIALMLGGDEVKRDKERRFQYAGVTVQFFASVIAVDDEQEHKDYLASARPTIESRVVSLELEEALKPGDRRISVTDKKDKVRAPDNYILSEEVHNDLVKRRLGKGDRISVLVVPDTQDQQIIVKVLPEGHAQPQFRDDITVRVNTEPVELPASEKNQVVHKYLLYNGPVKPMLLGQMAGEKAVEDGLVDRYVDTLHLNTLTDYHSPGGMGKFANTIYLTQLIILFTNLCHKILSFLHMIIPSYGICIVLLTVLVRGIMFPLSRKQALTSLKMQALAPDLKKLKEKFGDDRHGFAMAQMALFKKHNVSMFGSCWMIFLQMPIFMGLYYCLQESVHFRLAGFLWIDNLAAPDMLVWWSENIPLLSRPSDIGSILYLGPYLNLLPIVAVALMIYQQQKLMPPPADDQAAMQQKMMKYMMIFFGLMFYKVAAGLCVYFIASSLWGFAERKLLPKLKPVTGGDSADSLFQKAIGTAETPKIETRPEPNGVSANNRAKRRQERKRKQERGGGQSVTDSPAGKGEEDGGWWRNMWRIIAGWWQNVLKSASKK